MATIKTLEKGREAYRQKAWADAYTLLSSAYRETSLEPGDLEKLAKAAYLVGKESDCTDFWAHAHRKFLSQDDTNQAADCAFWLGMVLINQGERARGGGWIARARRLIDDYGQDCVEQGFLLVPEALQYLGKGDAEYAFQLFSQASKIGIHFNNPDLITLGRLGRGQALIQQKNIPEGTTLLDEAMVAVISDEISPLVSGIIYCAVIDTCQKIYDLRRAEEWTTAFSHWCDAQQDLVPYRGQCLIRRAEIMQLHGRWQDAMIQVQQTSKLFQSSKPSAKGEAYYRQAELYRLQGEFYKAGEMYRQANKWGRKPQPGLALLRLAQGKIDTASAAIRRVEEERQDRMARSKILPAYIEIMLAADDIPSAEEASGELSQIASEVDAPYLQGVAFHAQGNVLLAVGKPNAAHGKLLHAWSLLKKIGASYESARTRTLIGLACLELGDKDTAEMELDTARGVFQQLGAVPDVARIDSLLRNDSAHTAHGLTQRQLEVLRLVAKGKSNKTIAGELFISERTVERHMSDIFVKLDVSSRTAATAYAFKHQLV